MNETYSDQFVKSLLLCHDCADIQDENVRFLILAHMTKPIRFNYYQWVTDRSTLDIGL